MTAFQVHIEDDCEYETLLVATCNVSEMDTTTNDDEVEVALTRGGEVKIPDDESEFAFGQIHEHDLSRTIVRDEPVGIAYYLHSLEVYGFEEHRATDELGDLMPVYREWRDSFTMRDRRNRLVDLWLWRSQKGGDFAAEKYLDEPTEFRDTSTDESHRKLAAEIHRNIDVKPKLCYRNAQTAAIKYADNHRVKYVEGIALPKQCAQVSRHAWIEIDGKVAELTWPWHSTSGPDAVYNGVEFDIEEVKEARERGGAAVLNDEETERLTNAMNPSHDEGHSTS